MSPVRAELKVGHVPDQGLLRLEVDLATDKPTEIWLRRSHVIGALAVKTALNQKWERLRGMLVDEKEEVRVMNRLDESKERYFLLYRQHCLSGIDKSEVLSAMEQSGLSSSPLEPEQKKDHMHIPHMHDVF